MASLRARAWARAALRPSLRMVFIFWNAACGMADRVDASAGWPAGDNASKRTMERNADGYGWHTSVATSGTPNAENSVPPPPAATASDTGTNKGTNTGINTNTSTNMNADTGAGNGTDTNTATDTADTASATSTATTTTCMVVEATSTAATSTAGTSTITVATSTAVAHLVIAEIQIAGASSSDEDFVKLFDQTADEVDVSGWKLRKRSKSGADYSLRVFPVGSTVAPGGDFVWANGSGGFGDAIGANVTSTATLAADNSVALFDANGALIDAVAWGEGTNQYVEDAAYPANLDAGQVLKRAFADGALVDTDNNANDFAL